MVNRLWQHHFGVGIVGTPNDFGVQGDPATHPELLDWLAIEFVQHGWSLKHLHRLILLSRTYQMECVARGSAMQVDPENRLLGHFPRRRLEAESLRDAMLACSGTLNLKAFGPPVVPPLSKEELTGLFDAKSKWPVTKDAAEHTRRSVYLLERRTFTFPLFAAYDPPEVMTSCPRRLQTVVPTQALTLFNSPLAREQADAFARRLLRECGPNPEKVAARAWLLAFSRPITPAETEHVVDFLRKRTAALASSGDGRMDPETFPDGAGEPSEEVTEAALAELCLALFNANEFVYVD
jgi:hypothetical protein